MAYAKSTFQDLQLSLSYRYGESAIPAAGIDNRKYWINRGIEYIQDKLRLTKSVPVTVTGGVCNLSVTASADPAPDFKAFVKLLNSNGMQLGQVAKDEYTADPYGQCCITGDQITGYILNAKQDGDYTLYYEYNISPLVNLTDVCEIADPEAVVAYAYAQIRISETDPLEDADKNMQECQARIAMMAENTARNEGPLTFKVLF